MERREDGLNQDIARGEHGEWREPNGFLKQGAGSSRAQVQVSQKQRCPCPHSGPESRHPHTPRAGPSTPTAGGKLTSCLHLAMSSGQAQGQGSPARDHTARLWEERRGRLRLSTCTRPEAEIGVRSGRQTPPFGSAWEAAGGTGKGQECWEGTGQRESSDQRTECP